MNVHLCICQVTILLRLELWKLKQERSTVFSEATLGDKVGYNNLRHKNAFFIEC